MIVYVKVRPPTAVTPHVDQAAPETRVRGGVQVQRVAQAAGVSPAYADNFVAPRHWPTLVAHPPGL